MLALLGVAGDLDGDDVLGDVLTRVGAEGSTEYPGADEGAPPLLVLAPARQLPLGEQPLVFRGLLGTTPSQIPRKRPAEPSGMTQGGFRYGRQSAVGMTASPACRLG